MQTISITAAKAQWLELIQRVENGEEFIVTRRGEPVARMMAADGEPERSTPKDPA